MVRLGVVAPYALYFIALGVAALWLGYLREWKGLRWPTGLLAVAGVFGVTTRALGAPPLDAPTTAWLPRRRWSGLLRIDCGAHAGAGPPGDRLRSRADAAGAARRRRRRAVRQPVDRIRAEWCWA